MFDIFHMAATEANVIMAFFISFEIIHQLCQNFSVCEDCRTLCGLYHRLHHMKQKLYVMCSEIVEKRKEDSPGIDTTQILNQLLADDVWLETVSEKYSYDAQI